MYVSTPEPLNEGEEKHVISAFVADESGIINRVAGVFARRGVAWSPFPDRSSPMPEFMSSRATALVLLSMQC